MKVLVINCGSSSLKYQLIDSETENVLAKGLCERIGIEQSAITHQPMGGEKKTTQVDMPDHTAAVKLVIEKLTDASVGVIKTLDEIDAVGHRIVHGGEAFAGSVILTEDVMEAISACSDLAPPFIRRCRKRHIFMGSLMNIMKITRYAATVFMVRAMILYRSVRQKYLERHATNCGLLSAILGTALPYPLWIMERA